MTNELQRARIAAAQREGTRQRLIRQDRIPEELVDRWMVTWESSSEANAVPRDSAFWEHGYAWIIGERTARRKPLEAPHVSAETAE